MVRTSTLIAGMILAAAGLAAGDAPQADQTDDNNDHTYRNPRAEKRYDNRQQTIEQRQLSNEAQRLKTAEAQANEQARRDELKTKVAETEQKRKDEEAERKAALQAKRIEVLEKKDAATLSAEELPEELKAARETLTGLSALPAGSGADTVKALRGKALCLTLDNPAAPWWELCARDGDIARIPAGNYTAAALTSKGMLALMLPPEPGKGAGGPDTIQAKANVATAPDNLDQDLLAARIKETHAQKKLFLAGPSSMLIAAWGEEKCAVILKDADAVILPLEKWYAEDKSPRKAEYAAKVLRFTAAIRKANVNIRIFLQVGAKPDGAGSSGTAEEWLAMLSPLVAKEAGSFDGMCLVVVKTKPTDDPKIGMAALKQMLAWVRPQPTEQAAGSQTPITPIPAAAPEPSAAPALAPHTTRDSVDGTVGK